MIDVGAQHDRAQRPHQESRAEGHQSEHERGELASAGKEGLRDVGGVVAEDLKIVGFEKVSAGDADYRPQLRLACGSRRLSFHSVVECPCEEWARATIADTRTRPPVAHRS